MGIAFAAGGNPAMEAPVVLPAGYTKLAYIQSSGAQYINTGFAPNQNTRVVVDCMFNSTPTSDSAVFGVRKSNTGQFWAYYRPAASAFSFRYANSSTNNLAAATPTARNILDANKNVFTAGSNSVTATSTAFTAEYPIFLFAVNSAGSSQYPASVRIYSCQIYDNGVKVRDFIPAIDQSGNVGLWDTVGKTFYKNAGSGVFTGSEVA